VAGRLLKDENIERRGTDLRHHAGKVTHAKQLEHQAAARRAGATQTLEKAQLKTAKSRTYAHNRQRASLREAAKNVAKARQVTTRPARPQASTAKRDADLGAARKLKAVEQDRKIAEARATGRETRATAKAKADLNHAAIANPAARRQRAQAAQLSRVVQAKQRARKST
jgi:hypothetical protein